MVKKRSGKKREEDNIVALRQKEYTGEGQDKPHHLDGIFTYFDRRFKKITDEECFDAIQRVRKSQDESSS